jgi:hypothetical protein
MNNMIVYFLNNSEWRSGYGHLFSVQGNLAQSWAVLLIFFSHRFDHYSGVIYRGVVGGAGIGK